MFVFTGINIEDQLPELKRMKSEIEEKLGITDTVVNLPLHVSLRISSEVSDEAYPSLINAILGFYNNMRPLKLTTDSIEREGGIVWLSFKPNDQIDAARRELCGLMKDRFGIPHHKFDMEFKYHTTLFMGISEEKVTAAYELIKNATYPTVVTLNNPVIGVSPSGIAGTYKIIHDIKI